MLNGVVVMVGQGLQRRCRGCGGRLSRYNPGNSCRACVTGSDEGPWVNAAKLRGLGRRGGVNIAAVSSRIVVWLLRDLVVRFG